MKIYIAADHRGFELKEKIKSWLKDRQYEYQDMGNSVYDAADDYPDFASKVGQKVSENPQKDRGIVICGSGVGVSIVANRFKNVRCGLLTIPEHVQTSRIHDHINCLALGSDYVTEETAQEMLEKFLDTPVGEEDRFKRRVEKIENSQ